ncbi:DUF4157 domain-containing protein [Streptomyces sp. WAC 00631]|uniref:eCIS core domain-containing protein n=1 Tax=Streptomyces sp. WAC 00631 TaxID=2203201 RepID=UPI001E483DB7|nr:DUF4157 domain-containing protein [Streptomyces sp. WAC 00631]MCC5034513.1 DUF4157 domain-containing protein [Streptomyces sp. WAC 00631]
MPSRSLPALQAAAGNAAVVQLLRRAGHLTEQERHQHGDGCGHRPEQPQVQRSAVHDVLRAPGRPLDDATRAEMETRLDADFSDVRVHNDSAAKASAAEVGARAYTSGSHVVIGDGGTDKHTLAHELTHVIQQRQGPVAGTDNGAGVRVSDPADRFEREAEANATRVMSGPAERRSGPEPAGADGTGGAGAAGPVQRSAPAVQRMKLAQGRIAFTNVALKYPEYMEKAGRLLQLLAGHSMIRSYLGERDCSITLEKRTTETPADVIDKGEEGVFVNLASYYFENYDIGYIAGMLCHEFGIHPLAESMPNMAREEKSFRDMPFPVPGLESEDRGGPDGFVSMNSANAKQADHVLGAIPGSPRYTVYRDVALEMAQMLLRDAETRVQGAREQDVTDLLDCFLMDVASIAATNDDRKRGLPVFTNREGEAVRRDIATVYNAYKQRLVNGLPPDRQGIAPLFPQDKTPQAVKADFQTLMARIAKGAFRAWSIDNSEG